MRVPILFRMREAAWIGRAAIVSHVDGIYRVRVLSRNKDAQRDYWISELDARLNRIPDAELVDDAPLEFRARVLALSRYDAADDRQILDNASEQCKVGIAAATPERDTR